MLPRRTARAPIRREAENAVGMEAVGIPAPIPAARLSMERAAPRANASVGESMASLFLSAVSASSWRERSNSFTRPSTNRSRKLKYCVMFPGRRRLTRLPAKREMTRIRLDMLVTMIMDRLGTFILLTPYTKPAANASTDRAVTRSRISKRYDVMGNHRIYCFMVIVFRGFCSVSYLWGCYLWGNERGRSPQIPPFDD